MKRAPQFKFLFWHKLLIAIGSSMIILSLGLTIAAMTSIRRASTDIGVKGKEILASQTELFLANIVTGQSDTIDLQLDQARIAAINGARMLENLLKSDLAPDARILSGQLANAGPHSTTVYYASVNGRVAYFHPADLARRDSISHSSIAAYHFSDFATEPGPAVSTLWSDVHRNPYSAPYDQVVDALAPVYANGRLAGYIGISVSVIRLVSQFNHRQTIHGSYSFLIDDQQRLVSGPPHAMLELASAGSQSSHRGLLDLSQNKNKALGSVLKDMVLGNSAVQRIIINDRPKYMAYRPLTRTDWSLGLAVPVALATVASEEMVQVIKNKGSQALTRMVVTTLFFLGIALIAAGLITRRMTRPLLEMADAADDIAHGELERRVKITGSDEISELGRAFNAMTQQLKEYIGSLKRQQQKLFDSEARYRALFENSPISLWEEDFSQVKAYLDELRNRGIHDINNFLTANPDKLEHCAKLIRVVDINAATLKMYGAKSKSELLDNFRKIRNKEATDVLKQELVAIAEGRMFKIECTDHTLDGRQLTIVQRSLVPPAHKKTWDKVYVAINDVTATAEAEKDKKQLEDQLRQAYKMEAIGTLAGGIAHDFNNILSAIIGYSELLNNEAGMGGRKKGYTEQVLIAAMRAKDLVNQILAFSRQTEQAAEPVLIKQVVSEALNLLRASLPSTIEIHQELNSTAVVMADGTQIHQVIMNLCTNAGQAMQEDGGILTIRLNDIVLHHEILADTAKIPADAYLNIQIKDTGHGMSTDTMQRIFDPFFTTKHRHQGTGMGLAVVHGIINSHHGYIDVSSVPGRGTVFDIYLPVADPPKIEELPRTEIDLPQGDESILFVDDEEALADLGRMMLSRLGYKVTAYTNSLSALEAVKKSPTAFDLIITDMTMPNMTGDKLAVAIRGIDADIPIILCSGFSERLKNIVNDKRISDVLVKPLDMSDLAIAVRKALDDRIAKSGRQARV